MALYASMHSEGVYARQLLINPYFALGDETIDQSLHECELAAERGDRPEDECDQEAIISWLSPAGVTDSESMVVRWLGSEREEIVKSLFCNLVMLSDTFGEDPADHEDASTQIGALMEAEEFWGGVCDDTFQRGRKGFCAFKKKHLLATHSFSMHVVAEAQERRAWRRGVPHTQIFVTERDGHTRNGFSYAVAEHLNSVSANEVSLCVHRFRNGTDRSDDGQYWSNEYSMPHANLLPHSPGGWWESKLFADIEAFITGARNSVSDTPEWDGTREQCVGAPLTGEPNRKLWHPEVAPTRSSDVSAGLLWYMLYNFA